MKLLSQRRSLMKTKLIKLAIVVISIFSLAILNSPLTFAADDVCSSNASTAVKEAAGCNGGSDQLPSVITGIVETVIGICGLVAVAFIIVGGVQYMSSSGDASKIKQAKNTILYAVIGLIICALSFAIVNWVIQTPLNQDSSTSKDVKDGKDGKDGK